MSNEDQHEYQQPSRDDYMFEAPIRDMSDVYEKVITPKSSDKETTRDVKLSRTTYEDRQYIMRMKAFIQILHDRKLKKAEKFFRGMHNHYVNVLASDGGFTAKNIVTSRRLIENESKKRGGFLR